MNGQAKSASEAASQQAGAHVAYNAMVLRRPFTGVENAVAEQASALLNQASPDLRTTVFWPRSLAALAPPVPGEGSRGQAVRLAGTSGINSRALRILWEQVRLPFVLGRGGFSLCHAPAYLAPLAARCPVVLNVYDLHALDAPERCRPLNRWNFRLLLPVSIRRAAAVLVPSDYTAAAVRRRFPEVASRIRQVPLGISSRFAERIRSGPDETVADRTGITEASQRKGYLLCVGNIEPRKSLSTALDALRQLHERGFTQLRLVIAGRAVAGLPELVRAIEASGVGEHVELKGYVPDEELPALYGGALALVYPSIDEGFGLPLLEAMACGCPVVCSDVTAVEQTVGSAALKFEAGSAVGLAAEVEQLLTDKALRREMVMRGWRHAAGFTWQRVVMHVQEIYREVLSGKGS